jgi:hypothetical protein
VDCADAVAKCAPRAEPHLSAWADYNGKALSEILSSFRAARLRLIERLEGLDESGAARSALHPRLEQPMRVIDMMLFVAEHDDHHLARITELMREERPA